MATRRAAAPPTHPVRVRAASSSRILERLRRLCLALPEAHERPSHGEPTWFAGKGKVFAMFDDHHHGAEHVAVWLPMPRGAQEALVESDPARFFRPPYVGPAGWVGVVLDVDPDWAAVTTLVRDAFLHVATAKLRAQLDPPEAAPAKGSRPASAQRSTKSPAKASAKGSTKAPAKGTVKDPAKASVKGSVAPRWIALLRGINVGKHRRVAMSAVREAFEGAGATEVSTYIQSGNVVFSHPRVAEATLGRKLERALRELVGSDVPVMLRDAAELREVLAKNPFPAAEAGTLHVSFLAETPPPRALATIDRAEFLPDEVRLAGRHLYLHMPAGMGRSKLAIAVGKPGAPVGTVRNWRTVETLARLATDT